MSRHVLLPSVCVALLAGCGTKYIAELDPQELASSSDDGGGTTSADDGVGQTVTSGAQSEGGTTGSTVECEPDPNAVCGPPAELLVATLPPPAPIGGAELVTEYDCTITALEYQGEGFSAITADCGLEYPTDLGHALPEVTFDQLSVGAEVHVMFAQAADGNGNTFALSIDDALVSLVMWGTHWDPIPGTELFTPFDVTAQEDVCLAPCDVPDDRCYSYDRQILDFAVDGAPVASVWMSTSDVVDVGGTEYLIEVGGAQGAVEVNPDSWWCEMPGYGNYSFRIVDITP